MHQRSINEQYVFFVPNGQITAIIFIFISNFIIYFYVFYTDYTSK